MKIIISYPPLSGKNGFPALGQNRQFQFLKEPTFIYPVVPACAATLLKQAGHEVIWLDCVAENISYDRFIEIIQEECPDLIAFETKTPVVKQHWRIIDELKNFRRSRDSDKTSGKNEKLKIVLFGDHVTALPEESFQNSQVDFVLTGGDYDFLLLNLCDAIKLRFTLHASRFTNLEPGIYYRENGQIKNTGQFKLNHDLNSLPFIDRDLTKWRLYAHKNGNYKRVPGTYLMSGRDCWWGRCSFCSWPQLYPIFRLRDADNVLDEIGLLIEKYNIREIMDDTGTFPTGDWLRKFCCGIIEKGYDKKIYLDCNMRFGALSGEEFSLMKKANFRLLLFGLESANQKTLDRLNKNLRAEKIIDDCRLAVKAGLYPHITIMFGYPWETYEDALATLNLGRWLLKKGYAYTMQATVVIPYPGTVLFEECKRNNQLKTLNWNDYDMKQPVTRASIPDEEIMKLARLMYGASFRPEFVLRRLLSLKDIDDFKYNLRALKKVLGHIFDFSSRMKG